MESAGNTGIEVGVARGYKTRHHIHAHLRPSENSHGVALKIGQRVHCGRHHIRFRIGYRSATGIGHSNSGSHCIVIAIGHFHGLKKILVVTCTVLPARHREGCHIRGWKVCGRSKRAANQRSLCGFFKRKNISGGGKRNLRGAGARKHFDLFRLPPEETDTGLGYSASGKKQRTQTHKCPYETRNPHETLSFSLAKINKK